MNGAASISLSIHSATDSCDTSTSANPAADVCLQIPDGGGIAVGRHTIAVTSNSYAGYSVTVEGSGSSTDMAASDFGSGTSSNNELIKSTNATIANPAILNINTWGIAIPNDSPYSPYDKYSSKSIYDEGITNPNDESTQTTLANATFGAVPPKLAGEAIMSSNQATGTNHDGSSSDSQNIYYGANVEQFFRAGSYSEEVVYTATANLPAAPTNLAITPNQYEISSNGSSTVTITGNNLASAYRVWIDINDNNSHDANEECTNLNVTSDSQLTCNAPTDQTIPTLDTGTHTVYVQTQAEKLGEIENGFTYTKSSVCRNADDESACQVDIDDNMIPVVYEGYDDSGGGNWRIVTKEEIESNPGSWYNYRSGQWANAITLRDDNEGGVICANSSNGVVGFSFTGGCAGPGDTAAYTPLKYAKAVYEGRLPNGGVAGNSLFTADTSSTKNGHGGTILGYWVYIPRYSYEVMRPNAVDRVVDDDMAEEEGGFNIHFETADDTKKIPAPTCNTDNVWVNGTPTSSAGPTNANILAKDYRTGCWPNNRTYHKQTIAEAGSTTDNTTTWATHPAFSWGTEETGYTELNGIWVGKFETTGKINAPTVKPNQHANISEYIGEFYTAAKSIGVNDSNNTGGNTISGITQNGHHLATATSHMLKNSEWGAVAYLSASKYGAGVNGTQPNTAYPSGVSDADGQSSSYGITGCGPKSDGSTSTNSYTPDEPINSTTLESPTICGDAAHAYNGSIGVLASTTNTVYGIYDMSGGTYEHVMGNLTSYDDQSESIGTIFTESPIKPPYVDLYKESPYGNFTSGLSGTANNPVAWSKTSSEYLWNNDICTWGACGGHALHETKQYQSVSSLSQSWGGGYSYFVYSSVRWSLRGGGANNGSIAGLFYSGYGSGHTDLAYGFRSVLLAAP